MKKMLVIHASPRGERSHSRRLAESFLDVWQAGNPQAQITRREVGRAFIPHVTEAFVAANFYPEPQSLPKVMRADLQLSDELVGELIEHELLVISMPLYNFGVPSGLKAWIDQIVRMGLTFNITQDSNGIARYEGLLKGKKALIITSRGGSGFGPGGEFEWMNHADPHLRTALGYIGIDDISVIAAEGEESDKSVFQRSYDEAERQLHDFSGRF